MTEEVKLKECQLCNQMLLKDQFYKRKDRDGKYNWKTSYCKECQTKKANDYREENRDAYNKYHKQYNTEYYHNNKDNVKLIQKRYYYNKLPPDKQDIYKQKLYKKYPHLVDQICPLRLD